MPTTPTQGLLYRPSLGLLWIAQGIGGSSGNYNLVNSSLTGAYTGSFNRSIVTSVGLQFAVRSTLLSSDATITWTLYEYSSGSGVRQYINELSSSGGGNIYGPSSVGANIRAIVIEPAQNFFYATRQGTNEVVKIDRNGTLTGFASVTSPSGIAIDTTGNVYVGANGSNVVKITPGAVVTNYSSGTFTAPTALAYDDTRNMVVVGDSSSGTVYGITQSGGTVTLGTGAGTIGGIVTANGTIYIYDSGGNLKSVSLSY